MSESVGKKVGRFRVTETSFDDARGLFVIMGPLESGAALEGALALLPLPNGEYFYASIDFVEHVQNSARSVRLSITIPAQTPDRRKNLQEMRLIGQALWLVEAPEERDRRGPAQSLLAEPLLYEAQSTSGPTESFVLGLCAALSLLVLLAAVFLPAVLRSGGSGLPGKAVAWQAAALAFFVGGVVMLSRKGRGWWTFFFLVFACLFFFTSCAYNLEMHMT